jgi:hypothetical protein
MQANGTQITAQIQITLLSNGQMQFGMNVPSRFVFNAMMETAKQNGLAQLHEAESRKVALPEPDISRLKI